MNLKEIAALAGVSPAAISRYFNGGSLSAEKQERIRKVIEETNYNPNRLARDLRKGHVSQVGVIVPKIRNNVRTWMAVLLMKVKFSIPGDAYTTKGETVEFGTPQLTATVARDDTAKHSWRKWAEFGTEEAADTWLNTQLNI